jgi:hypothetical protein
MHSASASEMHSASASEMHLAPALEIGLALTMEILMDLEMPWASGKPSQKDLELDLSLESDQRHSQALPN